MASNFLTLPVLKSTALVNDQVGAFSPNLELSLIGNITGSAPNGGAVVISNVAALSSGNLLSIQNGPLSNIGALGGTPAQVFAVDYLGNIVSAGGLAGKVNKLATTVTAYNVAANDFIIAPITSANAITVKLPAPSTVPVGKIFIVKDQGGNAATHAITVQVTSGSINIDGAATHVLSTAYAQIMVYNNGTTYSIVSTFGTVS
jgi:hypothetical protein